MDKKSVILLGRDFVEKKIATYEDKINNCDAVKYDQVEIDNSLEHDVLTAILKTLSDYLYNNVEYDTNILYQNFINFNSLDFLPKIKYLHSMYEIKKLLIEIFQSHLSP